MKKAFLICPVRGHKASETENIVANLEAQGWVVHWPPRDTDQIDDVGLSICIENREAIVEADKVFIVWDGKSKGCLFDLGIAFALDKPIGVISLPPHTPTKSFQNMICAWEGGS